MKKPESIPDALKAAREFVRRNHHIHEEPVLSSDGEWDDAATAYLECGEVESLLDMVEDVWDATKDDAVEELRGRLAEAEGRLARSVEDRNRLLRAVERFLEVARTVNCDAGITLARCHLTADRKETTK